MELTNSFVFKKEVDWPLLTTCIHLTSPFREKIYEQIPEIKTRGTKKKVNIILENVTYEASLSNMAFEEVKWPTHEDILQLCYSSKSKLALAFQRVFKNSYEYIRDHRVKGKQLVMPDEKKKYLVLSLTNKPGTLKAEYLDSSLMVTHPDPL
jgi:5-methylcytosine-specific restriction enzyme A